MSVLLGAPRPSIPADLLAALARFRLTVACPDYLHEAGDVGALRVALDRLTGTTYCPKYLSDAAEPWLAGQTERETP